MPTIDEEFPAATDEEIRGMGYRATAEGWRKLPKGNRRSNLKPEAKPETEIMGMKVHETEAMPDDTLMAISVVEDPGGVPQVSVGVVTGIGRTARTPRAPRPTRSRTS